MHMHTQTHTVRARVHTRTHSSSLPQKNTTIYFTPDQRDSDVVRALIEAKVDVQAVDVSAVTHPSHWMPWANQ